MAGIQFCRVAEEAILCLKHFFEFFLLTSLLQGVLYTYTIGTGRNKK